MRGVVLTNRRHKGIYALNFRGSFNHSNVQAQLGYRVPGLTKARYMYTSRKILPKAIQNGSQG